MKSKAPDADKDAAPKSGADTKSDKADKSDKKDKADKGDATDKAKGKSDASEKGEKAEKSDKADKGDAEKKAGKEIFFIQTGSFQNQAEADNLKARIALLGLEAVVQARNLPDKGTWYRVRLGPYSSVDELNTIRGALNQNGIDTVMVRVQPTDKQ